MKKDGQIEIISAEQLYDFYDRIYQQYGDNSLIVIYGYVNLVRRSILDEYIVELQVQRDWSIMNVSVVFPKSNAIKDIG